MVEDKTRRTIFIVEGILIHFAINTYTDSPRLSELSSLLFYSNSKATKKNAYEKRTLPATLSFLQNYCIHIPHDVRVLPVFVC